MSLVQEGYVVLFFPHFLMLGEDREGDEYGTHLAQVVASAEAAVDAAVRTGKIDPERIAVAGHSFGGGSTASLLAETDLFAAGISIAGAISTLHSPLKFQYEKEPFWEYSGSYIRNSPSLTANKISEPLLLIHGARDGSVPEEVSVGMYDALKSLGVDTRLVLMPFGDHTPDDTIRQQLLVFDETVKWLDTYIGLTN